MGLQGIKSGDQGSFRRDQGISLSSAIWHSPLVTNPIIGAVGRDARARVQRTHRRWGPRVRILLPPPASLLRTLTSSIRAPNLSSARASWLRNANNDEEAAMERKKREGYF
jgi:hypothetical protein